MDADRTPEPRWPGLIALLSVGILYFALPESLSLGPRWLLLAIVLVLLIPIIISHRVGHHPLHKIFTLLANGVITVTMISSLAFLVEGLPKHRESPLVLLLAAVSLWVTNVLVFALWYWRLDGGGPRGRDLIQGRFTGAFLFPQMLLEGNSVPGIKDVPARWSPAFVDYLFLAFNTSTAFSPTDTAVLARWAKLVMIAQSLISLSIVALLAARAVNVL